MLVHGGNQEKINLNKELSDIIMPFGYNKYININSKCNYYSFIIFIKQRFLNKGVEYDSVAEKRN